MKKGILLAALAAIGTTGCESMKKGCKSCGLGYGANQPATGVATTAPATTDKMVMNGPSGANIALPNYSGKTINGPGGAALTMPTYSAPQMGAASGTTTVK